MAVYYVRNLRRKLFTNEKKDQIVKELDCKTFFSKESLASIRSVYLNFLFKTETNLFYIKKDSSRIYSIFYVLNKESCLNWIIFCFFFLVVVFHWGGPEGRWWIRAETSQSQESMRTVELDCFKFLRTFTAADGITCRKKRKVVSGNFWNRTGCMWRREADPAGKKLIIRLGYATPSLPLSHKTLPSSFISLPTREYL